MNKNLDQVVAELIASKIPTGVVGECEFCGLTFKHKSIINFWKNIFTFKRGFVINIKLEFMEKYNGKV